MKHREAIDSRIYTAASIQQALTAWRNQGKKIVFTNGCFDILHQGHIDYLSKAADCGDVLIVGVNSDNSVKRLGKGDSRPLQDEKSRALIMASLQFVNAVIVFDEETPYELIKLIRPDVLVKGSDYAPEEVVGRDIAKELKLIDYLPGYSTTAIEKKIKAG